MLPESFLRKARHWRAYSGWRILREAQQLRRFNALLDEVASCEAVYDPQRARSELAARAQHRRPAGERPRVALFGASDWEDKGLWQAWERAGNASLFSYALQKVTGAASEQRKQLQRGFLEHVTNMERSGGAADIAFMYASGERIDPSLLRELRGRGIWTVLMSLDDKHQLNAPPTGDLIGWQLEVAREADLYWTTWRAGADWLVARGVNAWYAPEGADPGIFAPRQCERDIEVLWLGRGYGRRVELVRYLRERGLSVEAFGPGWDSGPVAFDRMLDLYQRSKIVLGMGGVLQSDRVKHLKGRDFEVPMAGCLYLTSYNPELTDWFAVGSEILCYSSFEDCAEVITWVLRRPDVADGIRGRARCRALAQHTWDHRVGSVLAMIRGKASR